MERNEMKRNEMISLLQILGENKQKICRVSYNKQLIRRTLK
jgi:hypothetical protein